LASGSKDKTVKLWSVESQKEVTTLQGHSGHVNSVEFSRDSKYLASGSSDNTAKLWSVES
jgi:WD40 repeat protein